MCLLFGSETFLTSKTSKIKHFYFNRARSNACDHPWIEWNGDVSKLSAGKLFSCIVKNILFYFSLCKMYGSEEGEEEERVDLGIQGRKMMKVG